MLFLTCCTYSFYAQSQEKSAADNGVIAHRGAWKYQKVPQNSLASLKEAVRLGCEGSEFDVWMTLDSILVVNHDPDHHGLPIEKSTYQELLMVPLFNGEDLPTLAAYLEEGMKHPIKMIIEIKPSKISSGHGIKSAAKSMELVRQLGADQQVEYISFGFDICKKLLQIDPNAKVAYLNGDVEPEKLKEEGFYGLDYSLKIIKKHPEWIREAIDLGLTVNVWTVNNEEDMNWLLDQRIDFITTDEPELLFDLLDRRTVQSAIDITEMAKSPKTQFTQYR